MRLLLIEDEEKTSTYMSGFIASTPPGLRQLAQVLREHGDNDAATRADEALQKALENK